ncbi:MAG TPA: glycerate kinase, partial [Jatrophihabitantaceae bacterium]|nr:glycerate kinase [Jatrophihabitantaceae bacterium]
RSRRAHVSRRVVAAPDKFRGTATAGEVAAAVAAAAREAGWHCTEVPMSDGGEGMLACFGGANRSTVVSGPLGAPVRAGWRLDGRRAVVEMATASGLALVAGTNDAIAASTRGSGELIAAAVAAGAHEIVVGVGGSATTDGGAGAVEVLEHYAPFDGHAGPRLIVAVDVSTRFTDAARLFSRQKGADDGQLEALTERLVRTAARYRDRFGVDVTDLDGSGAAGGLAGGLAALGARLRPGFEVVAAAVGLAEAIQDADLVVTGEGRLDASSLLGKTPVGVARLAASSDVPAAVLAGEVDGVSSSQLSDPPPLLASLRGRFGREAALGDTLACVRILVREWLDDLGP